ncbi:MAG: hypothetical protein AABX07_03085 [Nanoarchaeota archaeon]
MIQTKAQEEIAGFVVIVVLVSILFVIFLGLNLNKPASADKESKELSSYLGSLKEFTTNCTLDNRNFANIGEILGYCFKKKSCTSNEDSCRILNSTLKEIFKATMPLGKDYNLKGYKFKAIYSSKTPRLNETIISISAGNCSSQYRFAEGFLAESKGIITYSLQQCF